MPPAPARQAPCHEHRRDKGEDRAKRPEDLIERHLVSTPVTGQPRPISLADERSSSKSVSCPTTADVSFPGPRRCAGPISCRFKAVPMRARCENACGKFPTCLCVARTPSALITCSYLAPQYAGFCLKNFFGTTP